MEDAIDKIETHAGLDKYLDTIRSSPEKMPEILFRIAELSYRKTTQKHHERNESEMEAKKAKASLIKSSVNFTASLREKGQEDKIPLFFKTLAKFYTLLVSSHSVLHNVEKFRKSDEKDKNGLIAKLKKDIADGADFLNIKDFRSRDSLTFSLYEQFKREISEETEKTLQGVVGEYLGINYLQKCGYGAKGSDVESDIVRGVDIWTTYTDAKGQTHHLPVQVKTHTSLPSGEPFGIKFESQKLCFVFCVPDNFLQSGWMENNLPPREQPAANFKNMLQLVLSQRKAK